MDFLEFFIGIILMQTLQNIKTNSWMPWLLAVRPKTLTVTLSPIITGAALAYHNLGSIDGLILVATFLSALFIQIGINLVNDALDFKKGADTKERLGPIRVTATGLLPVEKVLAGGIACFWLALMLGIPLMLKGGLPIIAILLIASLVGYLYTGGPYPLAYLGLGEAACLIFYGFALTMAAYFLQTLQFDAAALVMGLQMGCLSTVLLAINNLRDISEDSKTQKKTLAVRFGKWFARLEITFLVATAFASSFFWIFTHHFYAGTLPLLTIPLAAGLVINIWKYAPCARYNQFLGMAALIQLLFGILFAIGIYLQ